METSCLTALRNKLIRTGEIKAKVNFDNIADTYSWNENVACEYSLIDYDAKPEDRIYLFKSGWNTLREYEVFEWAVYGKGRDNLAVIFNRHALPQDPNEFYQFCYVTEGNTLCGASKIFQFARTLSDPFYVIPTPDTSLRSTTYSNQYNFESHSNVQTRGAQRKDSDANPNADHVLNVQKENDEQINDYRSEIKELKGLIQSLIASQSAANAHMDDLKNTLVELKDEYSKLRDDVHALQATRDSTQSVGRVDGLCNGVQVLCDRLDDFQMGELVSLPPFPKLLYPLGENVND